MVCWVVSVAKDAGQRKKAVGAQQMAVRVHEARVEGVPVGEQVERGYPLSVCTF